MVIARICAIKSILVSMLLFSLSFLVSNLNALVESKVAAISTNKLLPEGVFVTQALIDSAMPKLNQSQLGKILTRFYRNCLGGEEYWGAVSSYKVSAELSNANGIQNYESIYKKPNLYKITISSEKMKNILVFDGNTKWQKQIFDEEWIYPEIAPQMRRMIHEPELITFLLYPFQADKVYEYKGTVRENNAVCFKVRLFTKHSYQIDYFIDVETYCIVSIKILDTLKEFEPVVIKYSDHRTVDGVYFPHKINYYIEERWDSTLEVKQINTNIGAANWMFYLENSSF